jgi:hypothetical protein|tara:strand:- start:6535 stop:7086 length:552 start_codon:yes stop_codon:yes gene_type:complete
VTIYLPLAVEVYNKTFSGVKRQKKVKAKHNVYKWGDQTIVSPQKKLTEASTPENLADLKKEIRGNKMLIIDRVRSREPIIQIIDHRNQTGINPLTGNTPIDNLPRFPDVSKLYDKTERGLAKEVVSCVGPGRFEEKKETNISEAVALISLSAAYVGWRICALGWNQEYNFTGKELFKAVRAFS